MRQKIIKGLSLYFKMMKFEYDREVDAAYIYLEDTISENEVKKTIQLEENIILDLDKNDKLIGVEILDASKVIKQKTLLKATLI